MPETLTHTLRIALIGNPNSGKSTLFNSLTGLNQKTGNYPGVTVDKHLGTSRHRSGDTQYTYTIYDLPGTYSLYPKSLDEEVACKALLGLEGEEQPDVAVIVSDASNLKRHLLLATQVIDLQLPTVVVLNMIDEAEKAEISLHTQELSRLLDVEVIPVNSREKTGISELKDAILRARKSRTRFADPQRFQDPGLQAHDFKALIAGQFNTSHPSELIKKFEASDNIHRFNQINYIFSKSVTLPKKALNTLSGKADRIITHRIWGYAIFLLVLFAIFQVIFYLADFPMTWIEDSFSWIMELGKTYLPKGALSDLLINGVVAGLSGIVVFVPQIALLFLFIGILEDTGYMARVSFIMDKLMRRFGLNGRSVIPLMSGVACAVPAIMGTRTISNWKERLITIFITPLMSCSARLPVYTLLISMMMNDEEKVLGIFNKQGIALMALYLIGFAATMLTAFAMKFIIRAREKSYFIMELPVYRKPQWQTVGITVLSKVKVFLWDAGKIILAISIVLWFLSSHGPGNRIAQAESRHELALAQANADTSAIEIRYANEKLEASYAGWLGQKIEPAIRPLGFDWKIGIALITSFAAREVFVGTMATIYSAGDAENTESVRERLAKDRDSETGQLTYTPAVCWSLLIFYAFAMQCMSTLAIVARETKSWKWPLIQLFYMSGLAYVSSFLVYHWLR